ncbi:putative movement protein [Cucurbit cytorhabdovirus 1]|uniref:putative movement protein n=1 Tax=Cucurbit cytorhabdovirus 1 TaxID=2730538 RepID=UPI0024819ED6|nr:putative movement protein [Cucurbit cytorhabdovirus 1]QLT57526.1 putative movement protein [Cucurbit cytorhabdovirus 1]
MCAFYLTKEYPFTKNNPKLPKSHLPIFIYSSMCACLYLSINKKLRTTLSSTCIKALMTTKKLSKDYESLEKSRPRAIRHLQHQEELAIIKPFAFFDSILKRYCRLSTLSITVEPCFRALSHDLLIIRIVDGRYQPSNPLREYCRIDTSVTDSRTWVISDFPTVPKGTASPYRIEIESKIEGIKFGETICYLRIIPSFFYTNRAEQPSKVTVKEMIAGELRDPVSKETLFRVKSSISSVSRTVA